MFSSNLHSTVLPFVFELVPSHAPRLLQVFAKTSNSVFVKWEPIPKHHVKGILQGYHVHYSQEDTSYPVIKNVMTVNGSVTHVTLDSMKPLTRYRVWITGFTAKGVGPNSEKEFVSTPQPGKYFLIFRKKALPLIPWFFFISFKLTVGMWLIVFCYNRKVQLTAEE